MRATEELMDQINSKSVHGKVALCTSQACSVITGFLLKKTSSQTPLDGKLLRKIRTIKYDETVLKKKQNDLQVFQSPRFSKKRSFLMQTFKQFRESVFSLCRVSSLFLTGFIVFVTLMSKRSTVAFHLSRIWTLIQVPSFTEGRSISQCSVSKTNHITHYCKYLHLYDKVVRC